MLKYSLTYIMHISVVYINMEKVQRNQSSVKHWKYHSNNLTNPLFFNWQGHAICGLYISLFNLDRKLSLVEKMILVLPSAVTHLRQGTLSPGHRNCYTQRRRYFGIKYGTLRRLNMNKYCLI